MAIIQEKDKNKWTKDGRSWYFTYSYKDIYNKTHRTTSKLYKTKKEAKDEELLFLLKKDSNIKNLDFKIVALAYFEDLEKKRKQSTVYTYKKNYNNLIKGYFEGININDIDLPFIRKWAITMQNTGLSINYLNRIHTLLKGIFDYAVKNFELKTNPVSIFGRFQTTNDTIIDDKTKLRYITYEEFNQFISCVDNKLYHAFFTFAYFTGCRKGEILALNWDDIDFKSNTIYINKTLHQEIKGKVYIGTNKTNTNRRIQMSKVLKNELEEYKNYVSKFDDFNESWYVFGNSSYLPTTNIDRYKKRYFEVSGVNEITMHEFRHSHVSLLINQYIKTGQTDTAKFFLMVSNRLGHSIEVMQKTYMHLFPTAQDEIVDILDNL